MDGSAVPSMRWTRSSDVLSPRWRMHPRRVAIVVGSVESTRSKKGNMKLRVFSAFIMSGPSIIPAYVKYFHFIKFKNLINIRALNGFQNFMEASVL